MLEGDIASSSLAVPALLPCQSGHRPQLPLQ